VQALENSEVSFTDYLFDDGVPSEVLNSPTVDWVLTFFAFIIIALLILKTRKKWERL
jgi:hypothetical protein